MSNALEDLVRSTLAEHAPTSAGHTDWAALQARARRRTVTGRATAVAGAAAVGALALTTPWYNPSVTVAPSAVIPTMSQTPVYTEPPSPPPSETPVAQLAPSVVDTALTHSRSPNGDWSRGSATHEAIELALATLMESDLVTDSSAQPQVIWAQAGGNPDVAQGPQVVVAVEQADGWVVGYISERSDRPDEAMTFGTMPGGPITDRFVRLVIPDEDLGTDDARHIIYVAPEAATRVVQVLDEALAEYFDEPVGTEIELKIGFGDYAMSPPPTIRAYAADGTLLDEQTYDQ